ncbi:MAG: DUF3662 domain-containing protein [Anaerolineales bacterium]|nr:DUF3662 domain-containing protein [Anaerolineales bacterium]MCA9928291.1 DUF3662 domain-containing protein [Anaerolineales bacterium]
MMESKSFSRFEAMARRLVEGSFKRLFGGRLEPLEVATQLARVVEDSQQGGKVATRYLVKFNPADYDAILANHASLADDLAQYVLEMAREASLVLPVRPDITLSTDPSLDLHEVSIQAVHPQRPNANTTQVHKLDKSNHKIKDAIAAVDAYLIIAGRQHVPMAKPLITIGRRMDNDIVLDSAAVSRRHAQIRWRYGRFILYDLSNRGRTLVNGERVTERALQAGDVIGISNVMLIYGEGQTGPHTAVKSDDDSNTTQMMPKETE